MAFAPSTNLAHAQANAFLTEANAASFGAADAYEAGVYANAALGAAWVDLTSPGFNSLGVLGGACDANLSFTSLLFFNDSLNECYLLLRPNLADLVTVAIPLPPGSVTPVPCSRVDKGAQVGTISIRAAGAGSAVRIVAYFSNLP